MLTPFGFSKYVVSRNFYSQAACLESVTFNQKRLQELDNSEQDKQNREGIERDIAFWTRFLDHWIDGTVAEYLSYADLREKYLKGEYILAYYGDDREIKVQISKNIEKVDLQDVYSLQDHPSKQLVKYLVNLKTTEAFAKTNGNEASAAEIHAWFDRFQNVLRSIYSDDTLELKFDIETFAFTICQAGHDPFDFNSMSMGYAAVFDIIGDLIMRMESKRRYDLEGLVLIDEIETHLHVDLQKKIVPILTQLFPNIQFILTTHSPFVLNSTANAVVYDLEKKLLVKDGLTDLPYEGVVEGYFDTDLLSAELRQMPQDAFTSRIQTLGEALETHCAELLYARTYPAGFDVLTEREREICALIAARLSNREIAARLFLSEGSVKQYCNRIYSKLNIEGDARSKRRRLAAWMANC